MPAAVGQDNNAAPAIAAPAIAAAPIAAPIAPAAAPAVAPTVTPIEAAAASPLSDVTFTSQPAGANVVIVDEGKPMQLGKTPITASIDVHKAYDVVFALDGHPTKMATLAVGATNIAADLDTTAPATTTHATAKPAAVVVAAAPVKSEEPAIHKQAKHEQVAAVEPEKHHAKRVAEVDDAPAPTKSKKSSKADAAQSLAAPKGPAGTLMIASKPPCAISVDGKSTGLTTPQRDLQLAAGTHTISLVNSENGIRKTVKVTIVSGKATKAMLDFTSLLK